MDWNIEWSRNNLLIGDSGRLLGDELSPYNITSYNSTGTIHGRLSILGSSVVSFVKGENQLRCEYLGYTSPDVDLRIPGA